MAVNDCIGSGQNVRMNERGSPNAMFRMQTLRFAVAIAGIFLAAPALQAADDTKPVRLCVSTRLIDNWKPTGRAEIIVSTAPDKHYKVTFMAHCAHMTWSVFARVNTRPTGTAFCLSRGDVIIFGRGPRKADDTFAEETHCTIKSVEPYLEPVTEPAAEPAHQPEKP